MIVTELGKLFEIGSSKRVLKSQWQNKGVPFYRGREITRLSSSGHVSNEHYISTELYSEFKNKYGVPQAGDIMITAIGTIGNTYIVKDGDEFYFKDASVLWLRNKGGVNSRYVDLWFKSQYFYDQLDQGNGTTVDTLTIKKLHSIKIELPPIDEQLRIVAQLDAALERLDQATKLTRKNLDNINILRQSILTQAFSESNAI